MLSQDQPDAPAPPDSPPARPRPLNQEDSPALPPSVSPATLRAAAESIEKSGISIETAADAFSVPVETLHRWLRADTRHAPLPEDSHEADDLGEADSAEGGPAPEEGTKLPSLRESGKRLGGVAKESFQDNWERSARIEPDAVAPSSMARFCSRSPLLRWLVRDGEMEPTITAGTLILLGSALAFGIVAASGAWSRKPVESGSTNPAGVAEVDPVSAKTDEARKVIDAFLAAKGWEAQLPFVRDPETAGPLMKIWEREEHQPLPGNLKFIFLENIVDFPGKQFLHFTGHSDFGAKPVDLIVDATTEPYKIDWQATVIHQPMNWETFVRDRPEGKHAFRVFAELSDYYNFDFTDREEFLSLKLTAPESLTSVYAYIQRGSETGKALANIFLSQGATAQPVIRILPTLSFDGIPPVQDTVNLIEIKSSDWIVP